MSRKSAVGDLQAEEATSSSPLRRSTRTTSGNGTPGGVVTRRRSLTLESEVPAKITRGRRTSTQSAEENPESKTATRSKRATPVPENAPKETTAPVRRSTRRSSLTSDPPETEVEKPKTVRPRRNSRANSEDPEEEKLTKPAPLRGRRHSSATVESEPEVTKTPGKATGSRRSSAAEDEVFEPAKRTTRGRKASDIEENKEVNKPATRSRRKSLNQEEVAKPVALRRSRRLSADAAVGRNISPINEHETSSHQSEITTTEEKSPVETKDISVRVTPLKKRKIVQQIEADLELSIINESVDDITSSKEEELLKEDANEKSLTGSIENSPSRRSPRTKKRLSDGVDTESSPRKSPRLAEKSSKSLEMKREDNPNTEDINDKSRASLISTGSDGSFKFHLSTISFTESIQIPSSDGKQESIGSNKENVDITESAKVDKSLLQRASSNCNLMESMDVDISEISRDTSTINMTVTIDGNPSNLSSEVFNKKMPLEDTEANGSLPESSSICNKKIISEITIEEGNGVFSNTDLKVTCRETEYNEVDLPDTNESVQKSTMPEITVEEDSECSSTSNKDIRDTKPTEDDFRPSCPETEGSDIMLIQETEATVDISMKPISNPVAFSRKSSSPIKTKRRSLRKSASPVSNHDSTDSENDLQEHLRISRIKRKSKSKSKTPSPPKSLGDNLLKTSRRSKSKSKSPSPRLLLNEEDDVDPYPSNLSDNVVTGSKSAQKADTSFDENSQQPKGSEEVFIANDRIVLETPNITEEGNETSVSRDVDCGLKDQNPNEVELEENITIPRSKPSPTDKNNSIVSGNIVTRSKSISPAPLNENESANDSVSSQKLDTAFKISEEVPKANDEDALNDLHNVQAETTDVDPTPEDFEQNTFEQPTQVIVGGKNNDSEFDSTRTEDRTVENPLSKDDPKAPKSDAKLRSELDEFVTAEVQDIEESSCEEEEEVGEEASRSEKDYNEFIDGMAEEGEEDTPSEDSNQIIDEGESVGFSDSERADSGDDYDENDSFICDDEPTELLSGEEYDLDVHKKTKKSRIIDPNTLDDEDIIKVPKKEKPKRKSRIIRISSTSSEEEINFELSGDDVRVEAKEREILVNEKTEENKSNLKIGEKVNEIREVVGSKTEQNAIFIADDTNWERPGVEVEEDILDESVVIIEDSDVSETNQRLTNEDYNTSITRDNQGTEESVIEDLLQKRHRKSSLSIQENIIVDDLKEPIASKIKNTLTLVESFCSTVKTGEIALNLSLEYTDSAEPAAESNKNESVRILSDVKICPAISLQVEDDSLKKSESEEIEPEGEDLRQTLKRKKLKRKLSTSLTEVYHEEKKAKKRKKNKKKPKKEKPKPDPSETLQLESFSLMNQLITDVKNRPRRLIRPTTPSSAADASWVTTSAPKLKPSRSPASRHERIKLPSKLHPKDFKNQVLSDPTRVKRVETKTLLKKKGAFL